MITKPTTGMQVRLNDTGLASIGGLTSNQMIKDSQKLTVKAVECVPMDEPCWSVELEPLSIGRFLITNFDIELR